MKDRRILIRPPCEAESLLLLVTSGCSHNKCRFCGIYSDQGFETETLEQIEKDLAEASQFNRGIKRIFLESGDAFVLSAARLKAICEKIIEYIPQIEAINMYSTINNIKTKTDEELKMLSDLRIHKLYVGIETAHAELLDTMETGNDYDDAVVQLQRLHKAGIEFDCSIILGLGGKGRGAEVAKANADFFNLVKPHSIAVLTLAAAQGSPLEQDINDGKFELATEGEVLREEKEMISMLDLEGETEFFGYHALNAVQIHGFLPRDKQKFLDTLDHVLTNADPKALDRPAVRHS